MAGYGTDEGFASWLTALGRTLPGSAPSAAILRERGSIYIDATYGARFVGTPVAIDQEREWPRNDAEIFGSAIANSAIPDRVVKASYEAAYIEATNPGSLSTSVNPAARVKRNKVDVIEQEFFESTPPITGPGITGPIFSVIEGLLSPLLNTINTPMVLVV